MGEVELTRTDGDRRVYALADGDRELAAFVVNGLAEDASTAVGSGG